MASVWQCSIDYSGVSFFTGTDNPGTFPFDWSFDFRTICLPLTDAIPKYNPPVDFGHFSIGLAYASSPPRSVMGILYQEGGDEINPFFWISSLATPNIEGAVSALTDGGTLTITKDFAGDLLTVTSPVGTISAALSDLVPSYNNDVPLRLQGYGLQSTTAEPTVDYPGYAADRAVKFSNMVARQNGVPYQTIALSAADQGVWWPDHRERYNTLDAIITLDEANWWAFSQEATDQRLAWAVLASDFDYPSELGISDQLFFYRRSLTAAGDRLLTALCLQTDGTALYARVLDTNPDALEVGFSTDRGHTWSVSLQGEGAGRVYSSPSLSENPDGTVNLFAYDSAFPATRWLKSYNFGRTFTDFGFLFPLLPWLSIDHPKAWVLANGFILLSYNRGGHEFVGEFPDAASGVIHSTDFGLCPGGCSVYPGMWQNERGLAYVVSAPTGAEHERQSEDYGVTWQDTYSRGGNRYQLVAVKYKQNPLAYLAFQDHDGTLLLGASDDGFLTFLWTPELVPTVPDPIVPQYVGLLVLPDGTLMVISQVFNSFDGSWHIQPLLSADFGRTFSPA